jgi:hypothetical protein
VGELLNTIEEFATSYFSVTINRETAESDAIYRIFREQINVAEFYTMAHTIAEAPDFFGPVASDRAGAIARHRSDQAVRFARLYEDISAATRSYFVSIARGRNFRRPPDVQSFLKSIDKAGHAIVTFNWDEEIDYFLSYRASKQGDIVYTLHDWTPHDFLLLKPHGSIGWYDLKQGIRNGGMHFVAGDDPRMARTEKRLVFYYDVALPRDIDGRKHKPLACPPVITPPTFYKRFEFKEQQHIWKDVIEVCRGAREFVFLGYSLPRDDFLTRSAIRFALHANRSDVRCLVVDRNPAAVQETFKGVFPTIQKRHFLKWSFGSNRRLAKEIEARLSPL